MTTSDGTPGTAPGGIDGRRRETGRPARRAVAVITLIVAALLSACSSTSAPGGTTSGAATTAAAATPATPSAASRTAASGGASATNPSGISKVLIVAEENRTYADVLASESAPYLRGLADRFGVATGMVAGYPTHCPSLAAYIMLTSGSTHGICDDESPAVHPITGESIYSQVARSGRQWRGYAETMVGTCAPENDAAHRYLVRHAPAPYYVDQRANCARWDVPSGVPSAGALHDDLAAGALPAFSILTPDSCDDMHGGVACSGDPVGQGDTWLARWMPTILASPDYTAGRLAVILTWDEGSDSSNHIPAVVISPTTSGIRAGQAFTLCSVLRTTEELLALPLLGCAASAPSMTEPFHLG
jgi:phospholipase C